METSLKLFKSPEGETKYMSAYDKALKLWPVPYESLTVSNRYGKTHILQAGSKEAPPLILLHGGYASSTMWFPNIQPLSQRYHVLAVDTPGEPGKSVPTQRMPRTSDAADWLISVMDELDLEAPFITGLSRGGWLAINLASRAPERVKKLCLLSPAAAFNELNGFFRLVASSVMHVRLRSVLKAAFYSWVAKGFIVEPTYLEQFILGLQNWNWTRIGTMPSLMSDEVLQKLTMLVLLLVGDEDKLNGENTLERARRLIPQLETSLIPHAGHCLSMDQADLVNGRMIEFFGENVS
jgi:pimeloyl-ACP methyl ester carboxylesterase